MPADIRLQREHEFDLNRAIRAWYTTEAEKVGARFKAQRDSRLAAHHAFHDRLRTELAHARGIRPRGQLAQETIARVEQQMLEHKRAPLPDMADLEATRQAELAALDAVLKQEMRKVINRAVRGELDLRYRWSETRQCFEIPEEVPASAQ